jgi:CDP-4-dehydro-6-deoxyglucose reductase
MSHQVTIKSSGHSFAVNDGETVLAAALREGLVIAYSCRSGTCGTCKGRLLEGRVDYGSYEEKAMTEAEKQAGMALFCQARPLTDLLIDAREIGTTAKGMQIRMMPARVMKMERPAPDVMLLELKLPANDKLQFLAGQYVDLVLRGSERRSFSMANAPHDDELVQLHVRHVAGGQFTDHVFGKMKERDILRFEGPHGTFFLREDSEKPIVFVASGTGFAPIKAVLEHAFNKGLARQMVLYWGGRRPKDLYMNELALKWAAEHPLQFKYVPVISDALPEDAWAGRTGFVHRAVMEDFPDLSSHQVYACGVPIMVDSAKRDFIAACRLAEEEFYADSFTTQADLAQDSTSPK